MMHPIAQERNGLNLRRGFPGENPAFDVRWYQLGVLGSLLAYALLFLRFDVSLPQVVVTLASVSAFQILGSRIAGLPDVELKSALISGLSLCLLLRANSLLIVVLACGLTISSKFLLRIHGKHVFNPTNFGIALSVLLTGQAWVSPGQWGSGVLIALFVAGCGWLVVQRVERSDVTVAFLLAYPGLFFARALWLGDPLTIPLHQLTNGALLIFAFFMISDPKTTPDSRAGRILFAIAVAGVAYALRFKLYNPNALIYSLILVSVAVPVFNQVFPGPSFAWKGGRHRTLNQPR